MALLTCSLDSRSFQALLTGICKKIFYDEIDITKEYLAEQLYGESELTEAEIFAQIQTFEEVSISDIQYHIHSTRIYEIT